MTRHFLDIDALPTATMTALLADAHTRKAATKAGGGDKPLDGKVLAMVFEQPSLRTRVSFDVGMRQLGGETLMVSGKEIELGQRESVHDTAKVLSRMVDAIMIRTLDHGMLTELATHADVPVINGLTKKSHPCQVLADIQTFEEHRGPLTGKKVMWSGDTNNVLASWIHAAGHIDFTIVVAAPPELTLDPAIVEAARQRNISLETTTDAHAAADGAHLIITDTWVSMGDDQAERRHNLLKPYQVNDALMAKAAPDALFMHCLPAHRGEEVTESVIDGPQSVVFDEAENRLHAQKSVLAWCLGAYDA
ncbi:MAG: ornithine carbamoyltransferase [Devosiaceae bacterium]|nr:ornithine carbamoyltransferase [Devosiaceae bacterium MH13]